MSETNGTRAQDAIEQAATSVMKPYNAMLAKVTNGWRLLAKSNESNAACPRCDAKGQAALLNGICWSCYTKANGMNAENDSAPDLAATGPSTETQSPAGARCDFCGRDAAEITKTGVTVVRAQTGAHICGPCACVTAGCMGAKTGAEARAMMAQSQIQAEAVAQCQATMKEAATATDVENRLKLAALAETYARIARGQ